MYTDGRGKMSCQPGLGPTNPGKSRREGFWSRPIGRNELYNGLANSATMGPFSTNYLPNWPAVPLAKWRAGAGDAINPISNGPSVVDSMAMALSVSDGPIYPTFLDQKSFTAFPGKADRVQLESTPPNAYSTGVGKCPVGVPFQTSTSYQTSSNAPTTQVGPLRGPQVGQGGPQPNKEPIRGKNSQRSDRHTVDVRCRYPGPVAR